MPTCDRRLVSADSPLQGICAQVDGRVAGFAIFFLHPATWSVLPRCYLEDLFVDESCRGKGVGKALIHAVYNAADEMGAGEVYWMTETTNATARKLYDRVGQATNFIKYVRR